MRTHKRAQMGTRSVFVSGPFERPKRIYASGHFFVAVDEIPSRAATSHPPVAARLSLPVPGLRCPWLHMVREPGLHPWAWTLRSLWHRVLAPRLHHVGGRGKATRAPTPGTFTHNSKIAETTTANKAISLSTRTYALAARTAKSPTRTPRCGTITTSAGPLVHHT